MVPTIYISYCIWILIVFLFLNKRAKPIFLERNNLLVAVAAWVEIARFIMEIYTAWEVGYIYEQMAFYMRFYGFYFFFILVQSIVFTSLFVQLFWFKALRGNSWVSIAVTLLLIIKPLLTFLTCEIEWQGWELNYIVDPVSELTTINRDFLPSTWTSIPSHWSSSSGTIHLLESIGIFSCYSLVLLGICYWFVNPKEERSPNSDPLT